jgi:F-type H+-transporting ATPase subunit b
MIELNFTLIIQLVIVLSLMGILTQMVFKPFINVLQERKNRIEGTEQKAKDLQQQADELIERYREAITAAQAQGASIRDEIRKTSMMEEMAILEKAMGEANRLIQEVKGRITEESRTARVDLRLLAQNLSREITEKILGRSMR